MEDEATQEALLGWRQEQGGGSGEEVLPQGLFWNPPLLTMAEMHGAGRALLFRQRRVRRAMGVGACAPAVPGGPLSCSAHLPLRIPCPKARPSARSPTHHLALPSALTPLRYKEKPPQ